MSNPDNNSIDRRSVLKGIGAGATLLGTAGVSAAEMNPKVQARVEENEAMKRAADAFATDAAVRQALTEFGTPVREQLEAEDISVPVEPAELDDVRTFPDRHEGVPTAHIVGVYEDGPKQVRVHVLPQADYSFAVEEAPSGNRRFEADGTGPSPMKDCSYNSGCTDDPCNCLASTPDCPENCDYYWEKEQCCLLADGSYSCETVEYYCESDCRNC